MTPFKGQTLNTGHFRQPTASATGQRVIWSTSMVRETTRQAGHCGPHRRSATIVHGDPSSIASSSCGRPAVTDPQVLVVGGGPVGLTLAIDLGRRGVYCTLIEQKDGPPVLPEKERCNARTMEIFGRLGIADQVRAAGLRADLP